MNKHILFQGFLLAVSVTVIKAAPVAKQSSTLSDAIFIKGSAAVRFNYAVDTMVPLFVKEENGKLLPRTFQAFHDSAIPLLLTMKKGKEPYTIIYEFETKKKQQMVLWTFEQGRAWASPFKWRIDTGAYVQVSTAPKMYKWTKLADDGPTFAWSKLGRTDSIAPGKHTLEIVVTEPRKNGCYLLSQGLFVLIPTAAGTIERVPFDGEFDVPGAQSVFLWDEGKEPGSDIRDGYRPFMNPYLIGTERAIGTVVILPGGAYVGLAPIEAEPVAKRFNKAGFHAFVVHYRVNPHKYPAEALDAARAIQIVRANSRKWLVDSSKIALAGFSAGGHLSSLVGTQFDKIPLVNDSLKNVSCRPDAIILCYPVISTEKDYGVSNVATALLADNAPADLRNRMSTEKQVSAQTPPVFLWHCFDDGVDVRHSLSFAKACKEKGVSCEMHIYEKGGHGLGIAENNAHVKTWTSLCADWLGSIWGVTAKQDKLQGHGRR